MKRTHHLLQAGRAYWKLWDAEVALRAKREQFRKQFLGGQGFFSSAGYDRDGITLHVSLRDYLAAFPEAVPEQVTCQFAAEPLKTALRWPTQTIGELRPGQGAVRIYSQTAYVPVPTPEISVS